MVGLSHLDEADLAAFERDGYLVKRGLLTPEEIALCNRVIATDPASAAAGSSSPMRWAGRPSWRCGTTRGTTSSA